MVLGKTGKVMDFIFRIKNDLFSGDLAGGELFEIQIDMSSDADYLNKVKEQLHAFYKRHIFEFTDEDCDALLYDIIKKHYSKEACYYKSFTLFSNGKASGVDMEVLKGKDLTISVVINELKNSFTWETRDIYYKDLSLDDLFR